MLKKLLPYSLRKNLLDLLQPDRPGIGPVLRRMDRDKKVIFDIGANVGDVSCYLLHYFPQATVFGFEPCLDTHARLLENVAAAGFSDRFKPFRLGFFDQETEGTLNVASAHGASSMLELGAEYRLLNPHIEMVATEKIPLMRLDDFVARERIAHIDLVKIDVEGVELQVLRGGAETFSRLVDTVVMEISFVRRPREESEYIRLFQILHDYGFAPAEIYDVAHAGDGPWKLAQFDCVFRRF
ncbi:FkbM family methyltransferase [Geobacter pelophilus]|jgi:FkbM family methyltransferase|uniref:FkbM family methyltransferase n=1 Tax=Geoanaerobacter pelophilus TaxID=60036 RepID=A0AAW4L507_9BACT|nr:FkbM family methyltransferase [Geoanaerobacter pelophilus]MBT0666304.1 FkbM family methyltransferase [Geoanaerobacter pelophilus]